jgi:sporulation protein YlmC with PRC-barrel domain
MQNKILAESVGRRVFNHKEEVIGTVEEVTRDTDENMEYLILRSNRLFGNSTRFFAVPVTSSLIKITEGGAVVLHIDKDKLQVSIGIKAKDCPKVNPDLNQTIFEIYGYHPKKAPSFIHSRR